jgi:hypothetical protein
LTGVVDVNADKRRSTVAINAGQRGSTHRVNGRQQDSTNQRRKMEGKEPFGLNQSPFC